MACSVLFLVVTAGCAPKDTDQQQKEREDKTRDDAAKATERAKPEIQEAGRELGRAADEAAEKRVRSQRVCGKAGFRAAIIS